MIGLWVLLFVHHVMHIENSKAECQGSNSRGELYIAIKVALLRSNMII